MPQAKVCARVPPETRRMLRLLKALADVNIEDAVSAGVAVVLALAGRGELPRELEELLSGNPAALETLRRVASARMNG